jgi:hypothetical protein
MCVLCREYYRLEAVVRHNSFTELQVLPDHEKIHEQGIQHLVDFEERKQKEGEGGQREGREKENQEKEEMS